MMVSGIEDQIVHLLISLLAVIVAIFACAFLYKKFGRAMIRSDDKLKILATLPLSPKEKLLLVQVGNEQLLLGSTNQHISTLHKLSDPITLVQDEKGLKK